MRLFWTIRLFSFAASAAVIASSGCGKSGNALVTDGAASSDAAVSAGGVGGTLTGGAGGSSAGGSTGGAAALGSIIPDERLMDWTVAGVPGGIPHSTSICATVVDGAKLQAAINGCPPGGVVYVPTGVYQLGSGLINANHSGIVVRGDGPGKTVFQAGATSTAFNFGNADWPPPAATIPVTAGASKNSPTITVDSTAATASHAAFQVGGFIRIEAGVNPPWVHNIGVSSYDLGFSMTFRVTSLTPDTVTFEPPLQFDFSPYSPRVALLSILPVTGVGLEDFTIDLQGTGSYGIQYAQMWGSWIQNVEIKNTAAHVLALYAVLNSEIRHCYFHDTINAGPNTEGLDFYRDSDWNLIEDNIVYKAGGIDIGDWEGGDAGNVIAYNFAYGTASGDATVAGYDIDVNHASNSIFNPLEGNIAGGVIADGYFGSTSHDTLIRNWLTATHPTAANNLAAIKLKHFADYFNAIGNILGTWAFPTSGSIGSNGFAYGGFYDAPQSASYDDGWSTGVQVIFEMGFPNMGNTGYSGTIVASTPIDYSSQGASLSESQALDLNVAATLLRHGNYDYFHRSMVWDPAIASRAIPASLFRSSAPAYFGKLAWPPFDPASPPGDFNDTNLSRIPAGYRFVNGVDP